MSRVVRSTKVEVEGYLVRSWRWVIYQQFFSVGIKFKGVTNVLPLQQIWEPVVYRYHELLEIKDEKFNEKRKG